MLRVGRKLAFQSQEHFGCAAPSGRSRAKTILARSCEAGRRATQPLRSGVTNFPQREVVGYIPLMCDWCAGAGSRYGVVVSARTRAGSTSESLAQETSAITTRESAETRIIDFFMAGTVVDAAGQFNHRTPCAVKRAGIVDGMALTE